MIVVNTDQMRNLDRKAVEEYGIPEELLMENAGESTYFALKKEFGLDKGPITCVCGVGNNGGDGLVVARKLYSMGQDVFVYIIGNPDRYRGPARVNFEILKKIGIPFEILRDLSSFERRISKSYLIVDAIFGTGLQRSVEGVYGDVISIINGSQKKILSIDIPSGINGDNGNVMGIAVKADLTVTYGLCKYGNLLSPGFDYNGRLYLTHISFPPQMYEGNEYKVRINKGPSLPPRPRYGHKGTFGHVVFVGGAQSYYGAPVFSSLSFLKAGGGYSILAAPKSMIPYLANRANEVVFMPMEETSDGYLASSNLERLLELSEKAGFIVLGPGMGVSEEGRRLLSGLIAKVKVPILIDGDGLTLLSKEMELLKKERPPIILTPHPKEMERLSGVSMKAFLERPIESLREFSSTCGSIVVYKTARTLIAYPNGDVYINITGNSGMGTAGSGDVLTGIVAAIYCLTKDMELAARAGVFIHGVAGDIAAIKKGEEGITANDILEAVPYAMRYLREGFPLELQDRYQIPILL